MSLLPSRQRTAASVSSARETPYGQALATCRLRSTTVAHTREDAFSSATSFHMTACGGRAQMPRHNSPRRRVERAPFLLRGRGRVCCAAGWRDSRRWRGATTAGAATCSRLWCHLCVCGGLPSTRVTPGLIWSTRQRSHPSGVFIQDSR